MQRTKKRPDSMPGFQIGTSYLLVIFIILCLVTFAALALSSALRDQSYSQALAKHQTEYAAASTQASALLAQIDEALESETPEPALEALAGTVPAISVSVQRQDAERPVFEITALIPVSDRKCRCRIPHTPDHRLAGNRSLRLGRANNASGSWK